LIDVDVAKAIIQLMRATGAKKLMAQFYCPECGRKVEPHFKNSKAHFEHLKRNAACSLSDRSRTKEKVNTAGQAQLTV
jgi:competence CoiA-like predicted nuclease